MFGYIWWEGITIGEQCLDTVGAKELIGKQCLDTFGAKE